MSNHDAIGSVLDRCPERDEIISSQRINRFLNNRSFIVRIRICGSMSRVVFYNRKNTCFMKPFNTCYADIGNSLRIGRNDPFPQKMFTRLFRDIQNR